MKTIFACLASLFIVIMFVLLWAYHKTPSFLGATCGMSLSEAQKALKGNGTGLVDFDLFEVINTKAGLDKDYFWSRYEVLYFYDNKNIEYWYMPSTKMFESQVIAEFTFQESRLSNVDVMIFPLQKDGAAHVAKIIVKALKEKYPFIKKEPSKEIPGAYSYNEDIKSAHLNLWINLQDDPIIRLSLCGSNGGQHKWDCGYTPPKDKN